MFWWDSTSNVEAFGQWLGKPVEVASTFLAWQAGWSRWENDTARLSTWSQWEKAKAGREVMFAVAPFPKDGVSNLDACVAGQYDARHKTLANNLASYGLLSAYLRIGWEMNGDWYPWGTKSNGKEAVFAACFRRMVTTMRAAQPTNKWKFVWNPTNNVSLTRLNNLWPGDSYVDVVGIDAYDQAWITNGYPYPSTCDAACRLTRQQNVWNWMVGTLNTIRSFAGVHGKPLAFPEWGVWHHTHGHAGEDNPYFIQKMHEFIFDPANNVVFHSYLNTRPKDGKYDCLLTDSSGSDLPGPTRLPKSAGRFKELFGLGSQ